MSKNWNLNIKTFKVTVGLSVMLLSGCGKVKNSSSGDAATYGSNVVGSVTFKAAHPVLSKHCFSCHGGWAAYSEDDYVTNSLVERANPDNSSLYTRTRGNDVGGRQDMPIGRPDLSFDEIKALKDWILSM